LNTGSKVVDAAGRDGLDPKVGVASTGRDTLVRAIRDDDTAALKAALVAGHAGNGVDPKSGVSWTLFAVRCQRVAAVRVLAGAGHVDRHLPVGEETALHAAIWSDQPEAVRALLAHGADIEASCSGMTPLKMAASLNAVAIIDILLDAGARTERAPKPTETALGLVAVRRNRHLAALCLLVRGARVRPRMIERAGGGGNDPVAVTMRDLLELGVAAQIEEATAGEKIGRASCRERV